MTKMTTFAALGLLVRRRLLRDRWLVLSSALIVALATVLALSGPELVARTIDNGAADAATAAGTSADILVTAPIGNPVGDNIRSAPGLPVADLPHLGQVVVDNLPPHTASVVSGYESWVLSNATPIGWTATPHAVTAQAQDGGELSTTGRVGDFLQFGYAADAEVTLVDGELPGPPPEPTLTASGDVEVAPTQIAISRAVADTLEIGVGHAVQVSSSSGAQVILLVTGIVEPADPSDPVWGHFPEFMDPASIDGGSHPDVRRGTVMISAETLESITKALRTPFPGTVRISVEPQAMTLALTSEIAHELGGLSNDASELVGAEEGIAVVVTTGLDDALAEYPVRARAALAQMSVIIAGVIAVAAVVIALMVSLMLTRRESDLALERARGASVVSTAARLGCESLLVTAVGLTLGAVGARLLTHEVELTSGLVWIVALVSALSAPVLGSLRARQMWAGQREAANRRDRAKAAKARGARRLTLEGLTIVVAAAAVVSLRGRSVLQTTTEGIDPFLAATPALIALAIVVIVVRLYPLPMAVIQFFAKRTRGIAGVITLAKARERIPVLPLLALTLAIGIAVSGSLLISTVASGQEEASWERVGAEVRIDSEVTDDEAARLEAQGLTVSRGYAKPSATIALGAEYEEGYLFAMDANYPAILTMAGEEDVSSLQAMYDAAAAAPAGDPIVALASQELIDADVHSSSRVYVGRVYVPFDIIGLAELVPAGWTEEGPYLVMPVEPLFATETVEPVQLNVAFVSGPGSAAAVAAEPGIDASTVTTREGWLAAMQDSALIGGVQRAIGIAVLAVGALAAVGLLVTVLRGVRERGRALSMLRTQGMGSGYGWWLAFTELAPLTTAAVAGGAAAGFAIVWLLGEALGLRLLSGGLTEPQLAVDWTYLAVIGGGVALLLLIAIAVEVLVHRRNKLSEVLRWGESR